MDDSFQDLEAELRQLRPRTPSAGLLTRIEGELAGPGAARDPHLLRGRRFPPAGIPTWLVWPAVAALLSLGGVAILLRGPAGATGPAAPAARVAAPAAAAVAAFKPVAATEYLYESLDEGPVMLSDGRPGRRVCNRYVDTFTWRNPRTRASVQWTIPRAEVRAVPVDAL